MAVYNKQFYEHQQMGSYRSACEVFPYIFKYFQPRSAIDIGCGSGPWLKALQDKFDVQDICGVDGDYVKPDTLMVDYSFFYPHDLNYYYKAPRKYDIAISVEVAEHLPQGSADAFVRTLTGASDVVLFSAALVNQGGTNHINEQYPEYWATKFAAQGFVPVDYIRKEIWDNEDIEWWYRQNILLFVQKDKLKDMPGEFATHAYQTDAAFLTRIHPGCLNSWCSIVKRIESPTGYVRHRLSLVKQWYKGLSAGASHR